MNGDYRDNIDNFADWDEMTEEDWDRYSADFESRYNEHMRSVKSSGLRRVSTSVRRYYDEDDGIGSLLPTEEEINHYRRALGCDDEYNLRMVVSGMCRPHEDTMASFFLESCF